ncbi:FecR family protein [Hyella patelloides LEGE 07179]|uniref:FecR family protein n=1 Tax=Hyella patelloides LEGE 07179 TaxID=945734 RepID=A0A563VSA4_9CYAN|nr:FecR domain-containing protein [Hyella patelloides]VEP14305.1 FecR family protein [Hyella patelloides LEGE 07179]
MNLHKIISFTQRLAIGFILTGLLSSSVVAQSVLESAEIYKVRNQVELSRQNQPAWSPAKLGDNIIPQDAIRTGANSRADLLFNEGTFVRTGAGTIFRFPPGTRNFELTSGAALIMIRPGQGQSNFKTPEAKVVSQGTALFIQHDPNTNASLVGVLTNSPKGPVQVTNNNGDVSIELNAGQFVSIIDGAVGVIEQFILPMFYETVELASGLGVGQENLISAESPEVQTTINAVKAEALEPLTNQLAWLNGFCRFDVNSQGIPELMQWLGIGVPGAQLSLKLPQTDLLVIPVRSLTGLSWLGNYCKSNQLTTDEPQPTTNN